MIGMGTARWQQDGAHVSDETLLLFLDEELRGRKHRQVRRHLTACWACRSRLERLRSTISWFMEARAANDSAPPAGWRGFDYRLREVASDDPDGSSFLGRRLRRAWPPAAAGVVALAVALLLFWGPFASVQRVSANEVLNRAENAELAKMAAVGTPLVYQKIELRRRSTRAPREHRATFEIWTDPVGSRQRRSGEDPLWQEFDGVLQGNGMRGRRPLSASGFDGWRSALRKRREEVVEERLPDGSTSLVLSAFREGPFRENEIIDATLRVRASDWHPVSQSLRVQAESEVRQYELTETAYDVVALSTRPEIFSKQELAAAPSPAVSSPLAPPRSEEPAPASADLDAAEVEARYVLHRLKACLGEPVEVIRDARGRIVVRGLTETRERQRELMEALSEVPLVRAEIQAVDEHAGRDAPPGDPSAEVVPAAPQMKRKNRPALADAPLRSYFAGAGDPAQVALRVNTFSNAAISLAGSASAEAWALERLSRTYPPAKVAELRSASQRLLEDMARDHLTALDDLSSRLFALLNPALSPLVPPSGGPDLETSSGGGEQFEDLLSRVQTANGHTRALFAGRQDEDENDAAALVLRSGALLRGLTGIQTLCRRWNEHLAKRFSDPAGAPKSDSRSIP